MFCLIVINHACKQQMRAILNLRRNYVVLRI